MDTDYAPACDRRGQGHVFVSSSEAGVEGVDHHTSAKVSRASDQDRPPGEKLDLSV